MYQSRAFKVAILGSGKFLVTLTLLLCAAVLSRIFNKTDYAAYRQTILVYKFLSPILVLGFPLALYYFLPREKEKGRSILTGNLILLFLMGCLFTIAILCGGNELLAKMFGNPALSRLLLIYSPYSLFALPVMAINSCLVCNNKIKTLTIYNVLSKVIIFAFIVGPALIWRTPEAAIYGAVVSAFLLFFPAILLMYQVTIEGGWQPSITNILSQIKYSIPIGLAMMFGVLILSIDKVIVSSMCSPSDFAVYINGALEIPLIGVVTGSVTAVLMPDITRMYKEGKLTEAISLWKRSAVKCATFLIPMMFLFFCMAPELMSIIFSKKYLDSVIPFRFYLLLLPCRIVMFAAMIMAAGKSVLILIRSVADFGLNIVLSVIFVHFFGYIGAVIATIIVMYVWHLPFNTIIIGRVYRVKVTEIYPYQSLLKIFMLSLLACLVFLPTFWIELGSDLLRVAVFGLAYISCVYFLFVRFGFLKQDMIVNVIKRILH